MQLLDQDHVLVLTSYPPRVCGIATYTQDLVSSLLRTYSAPLTFSVCALDEGPSTFSYPPEVSCTLNTLDEADHQALAQRVNSDARITRVWVQHEFGLYNGAEGQYLLELLRSLRKPVAITFHTVLPTPSHERREMIQSLAATALDVIVLTERSAAILRKEYAIPAEQITVIPHGTHAVRLQDKQRMKTKYGLEDRMVLTTFGLLSTNKSIETAIEALPAIAAHTPNVLYLVLGRTHPEIVRREGEQYRSFLQQQVQVLNMQAHVRFVDHYLELDELLEYLQLTDVYLFTSKDPHQAVSGTFAYALGCGCPVISTRIPHAEELLDGAGILIDFNRPDQLAEAAMDLLGDTERRHRMSRNALHRMRATTWTNVAIAHVRTFTRHGTSTALPALRWPTISLQHVRRITTDTGMVQFCDINEPDLGSGYTLDDNARALIAVVMHHALTDQLEDLSLTTTYLDLIQRFQRPDGSFLNYMDEHRVFHKQNEEVNLEDPNGRAIWALGTVVGHTDTLPPHLVHHADRILQRALAHVASMTSPRAISFAIKGLYAYNTMRSAPRVTALIGALGERLLQGAAAHTTQHWRWIEPAITYGNAVIPEALLLAYQETGRPAFRTSARETFDFLLSHLFKDDHFRVISNRSWLQQGVEPELYGEQPIDVAYTIIALDRFHTVFGHADHRRKMHIAFAWFLGHNHLRQVVYNRISGGCHDGLEEHHVNLNQGAESTVCYLLARLVMERTRQTTEIPKQTGRSLAGSAGSAMVPMMGLAR